jgi:hypothetical protein
MAVLLSSRTWFSRPERSQQERTRREDRHSKFYEISDNLLSPPYGRRNLIASVCGKEYVAESCGLSAAMVRRVRRIAGQDPETGASEPDDRLAWLVELYALGTTVKQLSELSGVSNGTMGRIVTAESRLPKNYDGVDIPELLAARARLSEHASA